MNGEIGSLHGRRQKAARVTFAAHLGAAVMLGFLMVISEGPSAPAGPGESTARHSPGCRLSCSARYGLFQLWLLGYWLWLEILRRHAHRARDVTFDDVPGYTGMRRSYPDDRVDRVSVQASMAVIVAACWLAEVGYVPVGVYQVTHFGNGDQSVGFTIGGLVTFTLTFAFGIAIVIAKLSTRSAATTVRSSAR
jgi:hypothetical protein